mgnify:CR=1 FL=1
MQDSIITKFHYTLVYSLLWLHHRYYTIRLKKILVLKNLDPIRKKLLIPLIALMKDQVDSLKTNGIQACFINSSQTDAEQQLHIQNLKDNKVKMVTG